MSKLKHARYDFFISWDNPIPANSSKMLSSLKKHGKVKNVSIKTAVTLRVNASASWREIRNTIKLNLNKKNGKAVYVNAKTNKTFQIDAKKCFHWKEVK
ncbi:hypothetical protein [Cellvibrio sp. PSBB006]|uniref:hypothetical protein n=1 Tax=Cellvibrio sp. PSBB006 TaxID=1987723 RepID=UPI000B3B12A1|nr:hypothetical protein [Cellvibrio sp. PSBB006]ARU26071.1 hypothetical protein CBR65_00720 [Cellvibrio sp. PSBB006]